MNILELQKERILCRAEDPDRSRVLGNLIDHAKKIAKEEQRNATDADIVTSAKRVVKALSGVLDQLMPTDALYQQYAIEVDILDKFIPEPPSHEEVEVAVKLLIDGLPSEERNLKSMGLIMKALKIRFPDLEGKVASSFVRVLLG
jgi:uncharacterized protein YqeY